MEIFRNLLSKILGNFPDPISSTTNNEDPAIIIQKWRSTILNAFLTVTFLASIIAFVVILFDQIANHKLGVITYIFITVELALLALIVFRRLNYWIRIGVFLLAGYSLVILDLVYVGVRSLVPLYIILMSIVTLIMVGKRASVITSILSGIILSIFALSTDKGWLIPGMEKAGLVIPSIWNTVAGTLLILVCVMAILLLFIGFQEQLIKNDNRIKSELLHTQKILEEQETSLKQNDETITRELRQSNKILSVLYKITDAASSSHDMYEFFARIHMIIGKLMFAENFFIALYDESTGLLSFPYFVDEKDEPIPTQPLEDFPGMTSYIIRTGNSIKHGWDQFNKLVSDREVELQGTYNEDGIGAPLKIGDKIIGAVFVQSYTKGIHYTEQDDEILASVARHIATALTRFRALEAERQRSTELAIINIVQSGLAADLPILQIIEKVGDSIRSAMASPNIVITLYDEKDDLISYPYIYEKGERLNIEPRHPQPGGIVEKLIKMEETSYLIYGGKKDDKPQLLPGTSLCKSGVALPIISNGGFIGFIQLENFEREYVYGSAELRLLTTIAASLGAAHDYLRLSIQKNEAIEALRQSEERFRKIVNNLHQFISIWDLNMVCNYVSPSVFNLTGYTPEERLALIKESYGASKIISSYSSILENALAKDHSNERDPNRVMTMELEETRKDGSIILLQNTFTFLRDAAGEPVGILTISDDITEQKQNEIAIRESERRLADIINFLPLATMVIDKEGRITAWNRAIEEMTGIKSEDIMGRGNYEYALPFYGEQTPILIDLVFIPEEQLDERYKYIRRQAGILSAESFCGSLGKNGRMLIGFASALYGSDGQVRGAIESIQDVTELRLAETELKQAKEAAETANLSKSTFLANMSHEIRTPMNAILGFTQLMQRNPDLSGQQQEHLDVITRSGEHLLALINDILEISKIEAGRATYIPGNFNLHRLLIDVEMMFRVRTDEKKLNLIMEMTSIVPQWVITDEGKLRQVLINLIGNAVKFTEEGGIAIRVTVRPIQTEKKFLLFEVEDTGPGISKEEINQIFRPFEQASSGIKMGGTGLGLALSQGFIQIMGGTLSVDSEVGKGSVFKFSIPYEEGNEVIAGSEEVNRKVIGLEPGQDEIRILIADDRETNRRILTQMLSAVGFNTREVSNGAEAVKEFYAWKPHIIMMDMRMPVMDGYEAMHRIKEEVDGKKTVIIAVTASAFQEDKQRIMAAGADGYVSKPFKEKDLFETINQLTAVHFLYDTDERQVNQTERSDPLVWKKAVAALPGDLIRSCQDMAESADIFKLMELISEISKVDPQVGSRLNDLAQRYAYEEIVNLLSTGE